MPQPTDPTAPDPLLVNPLPQTPVIRPRKNLVHRHWGKGLAALVFLGLTTVFGVRSALGPIVPVVAPVRRELVQKVVASGRVRGPSQIDLGSVTLGKAVQVTVEEGQHVKAGELLIQLASAEAEAQVAQSTTAANPNIDQGGVRVDGVRIDDKSLRLPAGTYVVQVGKRRFARVTVESAG